ncbi:MAG: hypothetical protein MZU97_17445 [Bacillus subtilis]|nr:hypothetical protein [Bacillus subtilis]
MVALAFIAFSIGNEMKVSYFKRAGTQADRHRDFGRRSWAPSPCSLISLCFTS